MNEDKTSGEENNGSEKGASGLAQLFEMELRDMYGAEKALLNAIPDLINAAVSKDLVRILQNHLSESDEQVARLEHVFAIAGKKPASRKCEAMEGLIREAETLVHEAEKGKVRDAAIIASMQKIEHYEIASYGTLCSFATTLGIEEASNLLAMTLGEEKDADDALTGFAANFVLPESIDETE